MSLPVKLSFLVVILSYSTASLAQEKKPRASIRIQQGQLSVDFRDNSASPRVLSGIDSLFNVKHAPRYDAFDPDTQGASAGLNFEHIISGHKNPNNKFTPRHGAYRMYEDPDGNSVTLVRRAEDSPWAVESELRYTVVEPYYVDFHFRCTPHDGSKFDPRGYAIFFFANYMNDVRDVSLHFLGQPAAGEPEQWIAADAPKQHADWNGGGNYRSIAAKPLEYDNDVDFRLNTWSYDWPRVTKPFYYGLAEHGMTFMLMFDRLHSRRDEMRFSLYKFKLPKQPRPAWDFQYVIHDTKPGEEYGFRGRLVWKRFIDAEDCLREYQQWSQQRQADQIQQLRQLGATVFTRGQPVVEVNANGTPFVDQHLESISSFVEMTDLSLERTKITDRGFVHLSNLQKLEWLNLYQCDVGNEALAELKHLRNLQHLPIGHSRVTDDGLMHVSEMKQLVYLGLRGNPITNDGLKQLGGLDRLTGLHLGETRVTDKGIAALRSMPRLQRLWLDDTAVSNQSIRYLSELNSLTELYVRRTNIDVAGVKQLRKALPKCRIESGFESGLR